MSDLFECDNCNWRGPESSTAEASDLHERLEAGSIYTDRECPQCGSLAYPRPSFVLSQLERAAIDEMRGRGCAVVVFNPDELGEVDPQHLEDILVERAHHMIGQTED